MSGGFERPLGSLEAADFLRVRPGELYVLVERGVVPHRRIANCLYFSRWQLERLVGIPRRDDPCPAVVCKARLVHGQDGRRVDATFNATPRLWFLPLGMLGTLRRNATLRRALWEGSDDIELPGWTCEDVEVGPEIASYIEWRKRHDDDYTQVRAWMGDGGVSGRVTPAGGSEVTGPDRA